MEMNNQGAIVEALKAGNPDMPVAHAETWARDLGGWLDQQGYVLVKLPDRTIDEDGASSWGAGATTSEATDVVEQPDGRLALSGTLHPMNAEQALALASALIAGALWVQEEALSNR
ncbi:hypothetical protein C5E51_35455 [Nocardia nova]|uniref:hypothetical protein n=1 Tax=Nocardia nova TaxID=37330 RepID=UPI000CEA33C1|nr:hypothetical protein [Nocardia nova]PPJ00194.1 hypothetical protein C5E51_35455 [Nocardia nova]